MLSYTYCIIWCPEIGQYDLDHQIKGIKARFNSMSADIITLITFCQMMQKLDHYKLCGKQYTIGYYSDWCVVLMKSIHSNLID